MFRVGQKVVCVDARAHPLFGKSRLVEDGVYTVKVATLAPGGRPGVFLEEVSTRAPFGFNAKRFRPVVERKTDISFAHEILRRASSPTAVEGV